MISYRQRVLRTLALLIALSITPTGASVADSKLPAPYDKDTSLRVGIQNQFAPLNYIDPDTKQFTGVNVDLMNALGQRLGVPVEFVIDTFPSLLPALDSHRSDLMGAGTFDSAAKREKYTMVDYMKSGPVLVTPQTSPIQHLADVCGKRVGYPRTVTSYAAVIDDFNKTQCQAHSLPSVLPVTDDLPLQLGLVQGRYEVAMTSAEGLAYLNQKQGAKLRQIDGVLRDWLFGLVFRKGDDQLRDAVAAAFQTLIDDGTYKAILAKYAMDANAIERVTVDQGQY